MAITFDGGVKIWRRPPRDKDILRLSGVREMCYRRVPSRSTFFRLGDFLGDKVLLGATLTRLKSL